MLLFAVCCGVTTLFPMRAEAKAKRYYKIIYKLKGGKNPRKQILRIRKGKSISVLKLKKPTRRGYSFVGWYSDAARTKPAKRVRGRIRSSKRTVYAKWKIKHYRIIYHLGDGKATIPLPESYTLKTSTIKPFKPTCPDYRFAGWYADSEFKKAKSSIKAGSVGKVSLYAKWVPTDYWDEHLDEKCNKINELVAAMANPMPSIVFITDMHLPSNALVSPDLVRRIAQRTDIGMVVFGGDAINFCTDRSEAISMLEYVRHAFEPIEMHHVFGNHDTNIESTLARASHAISRKAYIEATASENEVREDGAFYYYRDDEKRCMRYLFMDSNAPNAGYMDETQLEWLKERVLELDETWTILVFVHQFFYSAKLSNGAVSCKYDKNGKLICDLLNSISSETRAVIAGIFSGHCHADYAEVSACGYPMVSTVCDAYKRGAVMVEPERKLGTVSEQAFDVITVDTEGKMVYLTRIGVGEDRAFSYVLPVDDVDPVPSDAGDAGGDSSGSDGSGDSGADPLVSATTDAGDSSQGDGLANQTLTAG